MLAADEKSKWDPKLFDDPRVVSLWDQSRVVGKLFAKQTGRGNVFGILWDAYFLYSPDAEWPSSAAAPSDLASWGRTLFGTRKALAAAIAEMMKHPGKTRQN